MSRLLLMVVCLKVLFVLPGSALSQSLTGQWVFQGPSGLVRLTLQQDGAAVSGTMVGADGTTFAVQGTIEAGRATGRVQVAGGAGWFAAGLVGERLKMVVAEIDPTTGQPDLTSGWELDFARASGAGSAAAAADASAAASAPPAPPASGGQVDRDPPQREDSPILREWLGHLRGKKLSYRDSYNSNDARGFGGYSVRWDAYLCSDGTFFFEESSRTTIDTGGATASGRGGSAARGVWRIAEANGQVVLQYRMENGEGEYGVLRYDNGATYLGRNRIFVTTENTLCR
jgi:hypothetical protein